MYHHRLVYAVMLLGVFTTRWRKNAGLKKKKVYIFFVKFAGLSFRLGYLGHKVHHLFHSLLTFICGFFGWEIFHLISHHFHM